MLIPGVYIKVPPLGGPTLMSKEKLQVQGITVVILPPNAPPKPGIEKALTIPGNSKENKRINIAKIINRLKLFTLLLL